MDRRAFLRFSAPPPPAALRRNGATRPAAPAARPTAPALPPLDVKAGLETFGAPLDRLRAAHLLRRTGFGAAPDQVAALTGMDAEDAIDVLVDEALGQALPDPPVWADEAVPRDRRQRDEVYIPANNEWLLELRRDLFMGMFFGGLRERLTLFWHNHFVTELEGYFFLAVYAHRYVNTLRTHVLGNFKDFVHAAGLDPAMLYYLNGTQNNVSEPNENYSRELLELFTMGQFDGQGNENYTQQDIEEIARALTGWVADPFTLTVQHVNAFFDGGQKTIFGRTGNFGYDDVIDLLFEERPRQIAEFVCRKLYREFVYAAPDEALVAELADVFVANDFELAPVVRALFKSAHFHDEQVIGAQIKSPVTMLTGLLREIHFESPPDNLFVFLDRFAYFMEQRVLDPPNVAGWEQHHAWLNTTTLPIRWLVSEYLVYGSRNQQPVDLVPLSEMLLSALDKAVDPADPASVFALPLALAEHLLPVPVETLDINAPSEDFAGDLAGNPIPDDVAAGPAYALDLAKIFLLGVPWYEWSLYREEAPFLLLNFTRYLTQTPEFQLT